MPSIGDIPDPIHGASRYSSRPFPPYRYVPGVHPHPTRDPRGHSYEPRPALARHAPWRPEDWRTLDDWLYGVDLFNAHYFWEAHEAWEGLWAAVARDSPPSLLLQGLIQVAAALLKTHLGSTYAALVLSREGLERLRRAAAESPQLMGLDLAQVATSFEAYFARVVAGELPPLSRAPALQLSVGA